jgi:ankyrin repeat protein
MAAVRGGHAELVKFLINRKANVNLADPCDGKTALHWATVGVNIPMIELLMSKGAKHDVRSEVGSSPLHVAAMNGHNEAVACLLDHGADINSADIMGNIPLVILASMGYLDTVKLLVLKVADMKKQVIWDRLLWTVHLCGS